MSSVSPFLSACEALCNKSLFFQPHLFTSPCSLQSKYSLLKTPHLLSSEEASFPYSFSAGSISSFRSQLKHHLTCPSLITLPKQPHPAFPTWSMLLDFLYKSPSECPYAFIYVYCLSSQEVDSTR